MTSRQKALRIARAALDSKADDLLVLDLRKVSAAFDYFVIAGATSARRAQSIADEIAHQLESLKIRPTHTDGYAEGSWVLLDYGSVVAHVFLAESRSFYRLERLWSDAPRVSVSATVAAGRPRRMRPVVSKKS
ncbi:MAG: ribosome silencing factor [Candidatus Omnitrophica bacterium]|nr:ribosome silencing factor [Candidatus Omnitrophota bacterium]